MPLFGFLEMRNSVRLAMVMHDAASLTAATLAGGRKKRELGVCSYEVSGWQFSNGR